LDELGFTCFDRIFKDDEEGDRLEVVISDHAISELKVTYTVANAGARNYYCIWLILSFPWIGEDVN
jgi:hypothetical protein